MTYLDFSLAFAWDLTKLNWNVLGRNLQRGFNDLSSMNFCHNRGSHKKMSKNKMYHCSFKYTCARAHVCVCTCACLWVHACLCEHVHGGVCRWLFFNSIIFFTFTVVQWSPQPNFITAPDVETVLQQAELFLRSNPARLLSCVSNSSLLLSLSV